MKKKSVTPFTRKPCYLAIHVALSLMVAQSVRAQIAPIEQKTEKIEVTGTRIPPPNLEGTSPVTVLDAAAIKADGLRSVENLLNNLPQVFADMGGTISNGSTGTATVNLRGLGPTRTLVLVDGHRLPGGSPRSGTGSAAADLNQVPAPLIKRVEVLTGGAGAVYGSDAVAGVVNFIMNRRFEGVQVELNQSFYNHQQQNPSGVQDVIAKRAATNSAQFALPPDKNADGAIYDANLLMGSNFGNGKGNATLFFNYKREYALLQSQRDFSACSLGSTAAGFNCGGSSTSYPGRFILNGGTGASRTVADANGTTRAFDANLDQYNFAPTNYYQRPSERYGFNASANYDLNDKVNLYSEFSFHDDHTVAQIAPSGLFTLPFTMHFENPLLSQDWKTQLGLKAAGSTADVIIARRNVEGGGRQDDIRHTSFRTLLGVKGEFTPGWNYDASMQTAKVIYQETYKNDFSIARANKAMDVVADANGKAVCRSFADGSDPACIPYNIWSLGKITPEALAYIQTPGFQKGSTEQTIAGGTISADLGMYGMKLPSAKNGVAAALGIEQRTEKLQLDTDSAFTSGDLAGQGGPTIGVAGKYTVKEIYGELRAPLIEGAQFAHLLSVNGSFRHSDYSIDQKTDSYGFGMEWAPVQKVRARGSYQKAVRAPNVHELYDVQNLGLFNLNADPCAGATPTATLAQCQRTGVTASQYGKILGSPAGQYNQLFGGNPNLKPEKSDSYTVGVVVEPFKDLSFTVDAFDIKITDQISTLPAGVSLSQCLANGDAAYCSLITRDSTGSLWLLQQARIVGTNVNIASARTSGVDVGFNYTHRLTDYGSLAFSFNGTLLTRLETEAAPGLGTYDCVGLHGANCGVPAPKWRHKLRGTWTTPWNTDLALTWRYVDSVNVELSDPNPLISGAYNPIDKTMGARNYFDLAGSWDVTKQLSLRGGINNLFDRDPPVVNSTTLASVFGNGNTYPQVYDALGRRVFINATYKF